MFVLRGAVNTGHARLIKKIFDIIQGLERGKNILHSSLPLPLGKV
jgi:hypothetical protein